MKKRISCIILVFAMLTSLMTAVGATDNYDYFEDFSEIPASPLTLPYDYPDGSKIIADSYGFSGLNPVIKVENEALTLTRDAAGATGGTTSAVFLPAPHAVERYINVDFSLFLPTLANNTKTDLYLSIGYVNNSDARVSLLGIMRRLSATEYWPTGSTSIDGWMQSSVTSGWENLSVVIDTEESKFDLTIGSNTFSANNLLTAVDSIDLSKMYLRFELATENTDDATNIPYVYVDNVGFEFPGDGDGGDPDPDPDPDPSDPVANNGFAETFEDFTPGAITLTHTYADGSVIHDRSYGFSGGDEDAKPVVKVETRSDALNKTNVLTLTRDKEQDVAAPTSVQFRPAGLGSGRYIKAGFDMFFPSAGNNGKTDFSFEIGGGTAWDNDKPLVGGMQRMGQGAYWINREGGSHVVDTTIATAWEKLVFIIDTTTNKYDMYVNGKKELDAVDARNLSSAVDLANLYIRLSVGQYETGDAKIPVAYFDNINLEYIPSIVATEDFSKDAGGKVTLDTPVTYTLNYVPTAATLQNIVVKHNGSVVNCIPVMTGNTLSFTGLNLKYKGNYSITFGKDISYAIGGGIILPNETASTVNFEVEPNAIDFSQLEKSLSGNTLTVTAKVKNYRIAAGQKYVCTIALKTAANGLVDVEIADNQVGLAMDAESGVITAVFDVAGLSDYVVEALIWGDFVVANPLKQKDIVE